MYFTEGIFGFHIGVFRADDARFLDQIANIQEENEEMNDQDVLA